MRLNKTNLQCEVLIFRFIVNLMQVMVFLKKIASLFMKLEYFLTYIEKKKNF